MRALALLIAVMMVVEALKLAIIVGAGLYLLHFTVQFYERHYLPVDGNAQGRIGH